MVNDDFIRFKDNVQHVQERSGYLIRGVEDLTTRRVLDIMNERIIILENQMLHDMERKMK